MSDLYFCRDHEKITKEEEDTAEEVLSKEELQGEQPVLAPEVAGWSESMQVPSELIQQFSSEHKDAELATGENWHPCCLGHKWVGRNFECF